MTPTTRLRIGSRPLWDGIAQSRSWSFPSPYDLFRSGQGASFGVSLRVLEWGTDRDERVRDCADSRPVVPVAIADIDGDGELEPVSHGRTPHVCYNNGGLFSGSTPLKSGSLSELSDDEELDLIVAVAEAFAPRLVVVPSASTAGSLQDAVALPLREEAADSVMPRLRTTPTLGDFDEDGCADLAMSIGARIRVWLGACGAE